MRNPFTLSRRLKQAGRELDGVLTLLRATERQLTTVGRARAVLVAQVAAYADTVDRQDADLSLAKARIAFLEGELENVTSATRNWAAELAAMKRLVLTLWASRRQLQADLARGEDPFSKGLR